MKTQLLNSLSRGMILTTAALMFAACSDSPVAPKAGPTSASMSAASTALAAKSSGGSTSKTTATTTSKLSTSAPSVSVLTFKKGVDYSVSASKVIGPLGGLLSIPSTGFVLIVPAGAVLVPTTFKVTPTGAGLVAYDFEPHGTTFLVPLTFMQDLSKTNYTSGRTVKGAYFADPSKIDVSSGTAEVSELFTLSFDGFGLSFFSIKHFSGYLVSMG